MKYKVPYRDSDRELMNIIMVLSNPGDTIVVPNQEMKRKAVQAIARNNKRLNVKVESYFE